MSIEEKEIDESLTKLVPINGFTATQQRQLLANADLVDFKKRQYVFKQGEKDSYTYYLISGQLEMYADDQLVKRLEGGSEAAHYALSQLIPRQMSALAKTAVRILRLDRAMLEEMIKASQLVADSTVAEETDEEEVDWMSQLLESPLFSHLPAANIQQIFMHMEKLQVCAGDEIIHQGDTGDYYYVIERGRCEVIRKAPAGNSELRLAELRAGDNFGEEALVSDAKRNASIRMLTDGVLLRLTKEDFISLISKPAMNVLSYQEAQDAVTVGAVWLDVRFEDEHARSAPEGSINIPLHQLRARFGELDVSRTYVVVCDDGRRSAVAAFLLLERGLDAHFLAKGLSVESLQKMASLESKPVGERPLKQARPVSAGQQATAAGVAAEIEAMGDADVRASTLKAELAKANLQLEKALRQKAQAEVARQQAEQASAEKVAAERKSIDERSEQAAAQLQIAKRLRMEVEAAQQAAQQEAQQHRVLEQKKIERIRREAEQRLQEQRNKLEVEYERNAEAMAEVQRSNEQAQSELEAQRAEFEREAARKIEEAERMKQEVEEARKAMEIAAQQKLAQQQAREKKLREEVQQRISGERERLQSAFARNAEELERANREKEEAKAARLAAEQEAANVIDEYKAAHEKAQAEAEERFRIEREKLEAESERVRQSLIAAEKLKQEALAAQAEAEAKMRAAEQASNRDRQEIGIAAKAKVAEAEAKVNAANQKLQRAEDAQKANSQEVERQQEEEVRLRQQMEEEAAQWLSEQELLETSTIQRDLLQRQKQLMNRIQEKADAARMATKKHTESMLGDISAMLDDD